MPTNNQIFDLDVRGFGILRRHEPADVAQRFERQHRFPFVEKDSSLSRSE